MARARLMDTMEDFKKLGINPNKVEMWEDGIRNDDEPGKNEVWYFDANFDDGSKVIIGFRPCTASGMSEKGFSPNLNLDITRPDGTTTQEFAFATPEDSYMSKEKCEVHYGKDWCMGDFKDYDIHIDGGIKIIHNGITSESSGNMIYEYNYVGREDERAQV